MASEQVSLINKYLGQIDEIFHSLLNFSKTKT